MIDASNDPVGDIINAISADVLAFGAGNTYQGLLKRTAQLSEVDTFPILAGRMDHIGFELQKVVYRGYSTSEQLQKMHDEAIAQRTKLKLRADTQQMEQAQQAMELRCKQERAQGEQELNASQARHKVAMHELESEGQRRVRDADLEQELRHEERSKELERQHVHYANEEDVRKFESLKELGVDLTKYLCVTASSTPNQHVRIDSSSDAPTQLLLQMPRSD